MIVVSDSTPLINLAKIRQIDLLKILFKKIYVPEEVYNEVVKRGSGKYGSKEVKESSWFEVKKVKNKLSVDCLLSELDRGEAEAIILAKELNADLVLIDQPKPRKIAKFGKLKVRGTLGILLSARRKNLISNLRPILDELISKGTWLSDAIYKEVIQKSEE